MSTKEKSQELQIIKADILAKNVCPELAKGATQLVFGDGSPDADILLVGEAPGKNEDLQGLPFVGAAGKFLEEMLISINLKRSDVYITNIVKYRPPSNRDPLPSEKEAFLPYLWKQILTISPKLVVTLGRHSMEPFLPGASISNVHGQPKRIRVQNKNTEWGMKNGAVVGLQGADTLPGAGEKQTELYKQYSEGASQPATQQRTTSDGGVGGSADEQAVTTLVVLPLFHPAAALYNGGMRQTLIDDFNRIPAILKQVSSNLNIS